MGSAISEAAKLGISMLTVHASGSDKMLRAAVDAAKARPELIVEPSRRPPALGASDLETIGLPGSVENNVGHSHAGLKNGCQGIVTSAREAAAVRANSGDDFAIVTPGFAPPEPTWPIKSGSSLQLKPSLPAPPTSSRTPHHRSPGPRSRSKVNPVANNDIERAENVGADASSAPEARKRRETQRLSTQKSAVRKRTGS